MVLEVSDRDELDTPSIEELLRQQESLRAVIESISRELDLRPLLTLIIRRACELLGADRGAIGLVDAGRNVMRMEAVFQMPPGELGSESPPGVGLAGHILSTQQPVLLNRYGDLDHPIRPNLVDDAIIGVPIFWRERLIGFFGIGAAPPRQFHERQLEVLTQFARHAAIAIENARLFEIEKRRAARTATINHIGQLITGSLSLDQILQTAVESVNEHLHYPSCALLLASPDDPNTLVLRARSGVYAQYVTGEYRQSIHDGIIGAAACSRRRLYIADARSDPRYIPIPGADNICAELALPLVAGEELLGVLNIESEHPIAEEDLEGLGIVADQLSIAIHNAHLFGRSQQALDEMQLLYETSRRIGAAVSEDEVIDAFLDQVAARGRYACSVALYEHDEQGQRTARVVRGRWTSEDGLSHPGEVMPYVRDALDPPLDAGQTVTIADVRADVRMPDDLRRIQERASRPALALIPLMSGERRIGAVVLSYPSVHEWRAAELRPYQATAVQLATAIDSRRHNLLLARRDQQVAVLEERQRLARDLHDSVTQHIFSMTLIAQSISPAWQRDRAEGEQRVNRLLDLGRATLAEMRALLAELRTAESSAAAGVGLIVSDVIRLQRRGLAETLRQHCAQLGAQFADSGLRIEMEAGEYPGEPAVRAGSPTLQQEEALFRIAQEALNNAVKHGQAGRVSVTLSARNGVIRLSVSDNGCGFEPEGGPKDARPGERARHIHGGLGLSIMSERAEGIGGKLVITSALGHGTRVEAIVPWQEDQS